MRVVKPRRIFNLQFFIGLGIIVIFGVAIGYVYFKGKSLLPTGSTGSVTSGTQTASHAYTVAPTHPLSLAIPKLGLHADVLPVELADNGDIAAPSTDSQVGWYTGSALPGQSGAVVIEGHASQTGTDNGVFSSLSTMKNGDTITLERGDHQVLVYTVASVETDAIGSVDMSRLMQSYNKAAQGLNLITASGDQIGTGPNKTRSKRVLVFAIIANTNQ